MYMKFLNMGLLVGVTKDGPAVINWAQIAGLVAIKAQQHNSMPIFPPFVHLLPIIGVLLGFWLLEACSCR